MSVWTPSMYRGLENKARPPVTGSPTHRPSGHSHLQSLQHQGHDDSCYDQHVPHDGGSPRTAEEVGQEEPQHDLSMAPHEEHQEQHQAVSLQVRGQRSSTSDSLPPKGQSEVLGGLVGVGSAVENFEPFVLVKAGCNPETASSC